MNIAIPTIFVAVLAHVAGLAQDNGHSSSAREGKWDPDLIRIEWDEPGLALDPFFTSLARPVHGLALRGQLFYDGASNGPRPTWSDCGLLVLVARHREVQLRWDEGISISDSLWWPIPCDVFDPEPVLGSYEDPSDLLRPNIDSEGRFAALLPPSSIRLVAGQASAHQVGAILTETPFPEFTDHPAKGWLLKRSIRMLLFPGVEPLSHTQQVINGSPSPCTWCYEPVGLIRAVNHLRGLGFDAAVRELRDYLAMAVNNQYLMFMCGTAPEDRESANGERFFFILRLLFEPKDAAESYPEMGSMLMKMRPGGAYPGERYPLVLIQDMPFFMPEWLPGRTGYDPDPADQIDWIIQHGKLRESALRPPDDPFLALEELQRTEHAPFDGNDPRRQLWHALEQVTGLPVPGPPNLFTAGANRVSKPILERDWQRLREVAAQLELYWDEQSQSYRSRVRDREVAVEASLACLFSSFRASAPRLEFWTPTDLTMAKGEALARRFALDHLELSASQLEKMKADFSAWREHGKRTLYIQFYDPEFHQPDPDFGLECMLGGFPTYFTVSVDADSWLVIDHYAERE